MFNETRESFLIIPAAIKIKSNYEMHSLVFGSNAILIPGSICGGFFRRDFSGKWLIGGLLVDKSNLCLWVPAFRVFSQRVWDNGLVGDFFFVCQIGNMVLGGFLKSQISEIGRFGERIWGE